MWNKQHFVVQHDNVSDPLWMHTNKEGVRTVQHQNVWGPYNDIKDAENLADTLAYNNQGWTFVVCSTVCAYQSSSTGQNRRIEGKE